MTNEHFSLDTYLEAQALDYLYLMEDMETFVHNIVEEYQEKVMPHSLHPIDTGEGMELT